MKTQAINTFPLGGVHPLENKISVDKAIRKLSMPETVVIPVAQHIGAPAVPIVNPSDNVRVGQIIAKRDGLISANVHSSVSGTVIKIDDILNVSGYKRKSIVIKVEGDEWDEAIDRSPGIKRDVTLVAGDIINKIRESGIVGLGGATFPSHVKLMPPKDKTFEYLLINGAECEPYLTSDHQLMLQRSEELIIGVRILITAAGVNKAFIGIENNKSDAIIKLRNLVKGYPGIEVIALKGQYPQGAERQLIKSAINREVPPLPRGLPVDVGCVVFNVGTAVAVYEAIQKNKPLIERVVTITGKSVKQPSNFLVRIGTYVSNLIEAVGELPDDTGKIVCGGPMMGRAVATPDIPITKGMSGVVIFRKGESRREEVLNCIRCAKCVSTCPLGLEPYLYMALAERSLFDRADEHKILQCCECGCCSYICPSNRPLLDHIKFAKGEVLKIRKSQAKA